MHIQIWILILFLLILFIVMYMLFIHPGIAGLLIKQRGEKLNRLTWENKGPTPLGENGYTPQGMTWVNGKIILANTWKNTKSRVYEIIPETIEICRYFDMPKEAVHTSGLAWDGEFLWGVDYIANRGYCIDLESSLSTGKVKLIGSFDTTLKGTSACCIVPWNNKQYLAISDFMRSKRTIFIRMNEALKKGSADGTIDFEYRNEGFSQGLVFFDGYLYESENKLGIDIINKIDLQKLSETKNARKATIIQYKAPYKGVEDLAWSGSALWTSDEKVFNFYRGVFE